MMQELGILNLHDLEARAKMVMRTGIFTYVDGGFNDEITYKRTKYIFDSIGLVPRYLVDVSNVDSSTTVVGQKIDVPVLAAPSAPQIGAHPDGDLATTRACGAEGTIEILSHGADFTVEEATSVATGPVWCNIFMLKDRDYMQQYVKRAEDVGCTALCWTVDTQCLDMMKEQMVREPDPMMYNLARWANVVKKDANGHDVALDWMSQIDPSVTWDDMDWLHSITNLPIVVKGILRGDDARMCVEHGAAGIVVSNHGARLVDGMIPSIEALPEVVDAVQGRCDVLMDGGVRRGLDVLRALCIGAKAVCIGRPIWYGLATAGEEGVRAAFQMLKREFTYAMAMCGITKTSDLNRSILVKVPTLFEAGGFNAQWTTG